MTALDAVTATLRDTPPAAYVTLVFAIAVVSQWIAWRARIPALLLLLLGGFVLGQWLDPTLILGREILYAGVSIAVGIILFEGSLGLRLRELRDLGSSVKRLCSVTVLIAWPLITASAWLAGLEPRLAVLLGALLVVTGPTVVNPILRQLRPTRRVSTLLRWEGIVVDPIGAVLATLVFQAIVAREDRRLADALTSLGLTLVVGFGLGFAFAHVLVVLVRRHALPDFLEGVAFLSAAVAAYVASNAVQSESGLLTVTVLGIVLANRLGPRLHRVKEFTENLQVLLVGSLFVILAGLVSVADLAAAWPVAAIFIGLLILVVRPLSIGLSLIGSDSTRTERILLAFMAPRGIVAASVTSIFVLELQHRADEAAARAQAGTGPDAAALAAHAEDLATLAAAAQPLVPVVFLLVVVTVAVYGLGVGRLAERLGLASTSPQGVLMAGTAAWTIAAAEHLRDLGIPVRLASQDRFGVRRAREAGVPVEFTHILSDYVVDELDVAGFGHFIAATSDDETNATAARELARVFGSSHSFHLSRVGTTTDPDRLAAGGHVTGELAFAPAVSYDALRAMTVAGMSVRRTQLSVEFTIDDFLEHYGEDAVLMFVVADGKVTVMTEGTTVPEGQVSVIAMLPARPSAPERPDVRTDRVLP